MGIGRRLAGVEQRRRLGRAGAVGGEQRAAQLGNVVIAVVILAKRHTGGHVQQGAQRRLAVFGAGKLGHVVDGRRVDRADFPIRDGDAEQHPGDGLGHRLPDQPVMVGPGIAVMLEEDLVAARDQQSGRRMALEVIAERMRFALEGISQRQLRGRAAKRQRAVGLADPVGAKDLIEVAVISDQIDLGRQRGAAADRIFGRAIGSGVGAAVGKHRIGCGERRCCPAARQDGKEEGGDDLRRRPPHDQERSTCPEVEPVGRPSA